MVVPAGAPDMPEAGRTGWSRDTNECWTTARQGSVACSIRGCQDWGSNCCAAYGSRRLFGKRIWLPQSPFRDLLVGPSDEFCLLTWTTCRLSTSSLVKSIRTVATSYETYSCHIEDVECRAKNHLVRAARAGARRPGCVCHDIRTT
jgi:hypothetical protein